MPDAFQYFPDEGGSAVADPASKYFPDTPGPTPALSQAHQYFPDEEQGTKPSATAAAVARQPEAVAQANFAKHLEAMGAPPTLSTDEEVAMERQFAKDHPYIYGAAEAVTGMVPKSWEDVKQMATLPTPSSGIIGPKDEQWGQAVRGEHGPQAQAAGITSTVLQALPLFHLPFADSPLGPFEGRGATSTPPEAKNAAAGTEGAPVEPPSGRYQGSPTPDVIVTPAAEAPTPQGEVTPQGQAPPPQEAGTVRLYHGSSSATKQAGRDFTPFFQYASDYAAKAVGDGEGKVWYVDVPEGSLPTHDEYGVPITKVVVPDEIADQAKVLSPEVPPVSSGGEGPSAAKPPSAETLTPQDQAAPTGHATLYETTQTQPNAVPSVQSGITWQPEHEGKWNVFGKNVHTKAEIDPQGNLRLRGVAVDTGKTGQGIGSNFVNTLLSEASSKFPNAKEAVIWAFPDAEGFWKKAGFEPTGKVAAAGESSVSEFRKPLREGGEAPSEAQNNGNAQEAQAPQDSGKEQAPLLGTEPVPPEGAGVPSGAVTVNGRYFKLNTEQQAAWDQATQNYQSHLRNADNWEARGNPEEASKIRMGAGMKYATDKRQITGALTPTEAAMEAKKEASFYLGKDVTINGRPAKVVSNPFGRVGVLFEDGTKATFPPDKVVAVPKKTFQGAEEVFPTKAKEPAPQKPTATQQPQASRPNPRPTEATSPSNEDTSPSSPSGISNERLTNIYGEDAVMAGKGLGAKAWQERGAADPRDPYAVLSEAQKQGIAAPQDVALLRTEHGRLLQAARNAYGTPEYGPLAQNAADMANAIKQVAHGPASDVMRVLQDNDIPRYDSPADFDSIVRERMNRESTPEEQNTFKQVADEVRNGDQAVAKDAAEAQQQLARHRPKEVMSFEEAAKHIKDQIAELTADCIL